MKFIRVLKADVLDDYQKGKSDKQRKKELENALLSQKRAWNYFDKYCRYSKNEAPDELLNFLMTDESSAYRLVSYYLTNGKQLTKEMLNFLKNNNFILTSYGQIKKGITAETLAQITKYITNPDVALSVALELKKKHMDIPDNIKKLMIKANRFSYHTKDFDDFDSEGFMGRLAKDPEETLKYISEYGSENLSEQTVLNMIKRLDSYDSSALVSLIEHKDIEQKYYSAILERVAKDIRKEDHYWSNTRKILDLFKLFGNKLPESIISAIMKDNELVSTIISYARDEKVTLPQSIIDRAAKLSLENEDMLYDVLHYMKRVPDIVLKHCMKDIKTAVKLYKKIKWANDYKTTIKVPQELIDLIASNGRICYNLYEKMGKHMIDEKEILNSAREYVQKRMNRKEQEV